MALSTTSFKSDSVRCKIMGAMRRAMNNHSLEIVNNRKGKQFLTVERVYGGFKRCFRFFDVHGNNITEMVYKALKSC